MNDLNKDIGTKDPGAELASNKNAKAVAEKILQDVLKKDVVRNPDFVALLETMRDIHDKKSADYAELDDLYKNFRECEGMGIPAWKGIAIRLCDKFSRFKGFVKRETLAVEDESFEDTMIDFANYALLIILLYRDAVQKDRHSYDHPGDAQARNLEHRFLD